MTAARSPSSPPCRRSLAPCWPRCPTRRGCAWPGAISGCGHLHRQPVVAVLSVVSGDRFVATAGEGATLRAALPDALAAVEMEGTAVAQPKSSAAPPRISQASIPAWPARCRARTRRWSGRTEKLPMPGHVADRHAGPGVGVAIERVDLVLRRHVAAIVGQQQVVVAQLTSVSKMPWKRPGSPGEKAPPRSHRARALQFGFGFVDGRAAGSRWRARRPPPAWSGRR